MLLFCTQRIKRETLETSLPLSNHSSNTESPVVPSAQTPTTAPVLMNSASTAESKYLAYSFHTSEEIHAPTPANGLLRYHAADALLQHTGTVVVTHFRVNACITVPTAVLLTS